MKNFWFILSILASILVWSWLFNYKMAITLVAAILIHEYGHYYWMGLEGIKKRKMFMIPPFGAMAITEEPWPSCAAENKIALAGPGIGMIALLGFYFLFITTDGTIWAAAVVLTAYINLINLLAPISVLDGGRVIKTILFSLHYYLGIIFIIISFLLSILVGLFLNPIFFIVAYFIWQETKIFLKAPRLVQSINQELEMLNDIILMETPNQNAKNQQSHKTLREMKAKLSRQKESIQKIAYPQPMTKKEIMVSLAMFVIISAIYIHFFNLMRQYIAFSPLNISSLIKYFS